MELRLTVMSNNLEFRETERKRKRESRRQLNDKKGDRELEREIKNKGDISFVGRTT